MTSTTSGLYISHRGNFHYVASREISTQRLLVGEAQLDQVETSLGSLVRRQVAQRFTCPSRITVRAQQE